MTCSRIWLNPLADDCHLDSILTKLEIKTLGDSLVKKTLKNKCGLLTCARHALWARRVAIAEWSAHSLLSSFLQESLFDLSFLVSHLLFTRWWLVPSRSRVVQFPSFLTVQLSTGLEFFFSGARATLLSINSPYFHTQKNEKRNSLLKPSGTREKKELEEILCHFQNFHTLLSYKRTITRFSSVSKSFDLSRACPTKGFLFF
jgi:hypothetical protein